MLANNVMRSSIPPTIERTALADSCNVKVYNSVMQVLQPARNQEVFFISKTFLTSGQQQTDARATAPLAIT